VALYRYRLELLKD